MGLNYIYKYLKGSRILTQFVETLDFKHKNVPELFIEGVYDQ